MPVGIFYSEPKSPEAVAARCAEGVSPCRLPCENGLWEMHIILYTAPGQGFHRGASRDLGDENRAWDYAAVVALSAVNRALSFSELLGLKFGWVRRPTRDVGIVYSCEMQHNTMQHIWRALRLSNSYWLSISLTVSAMRGNIS